MDFENKYLKYKKKYIDMKSRIGGSTTPLINPDELDTNNDNMEDAPSTPTGQPIIPNPGNIREEHRQAMIRRRNESLALIRSNIYRSLAAEFNSLFIPIRRMSHKYNGIDKEITDEMFSWMDENVPVPEELKDPVLQYIFEKPQMISSGHVYSEYVVNYLTVTQNSENDRANMQNNTNNIYIPKCPMTRDRITEIQQVNQNGESRQVWSLPVRNLEPFINNWWNTAIEAYENQV